MSAEAIADATARQVRVGDVAIHCRTVGAGTPLLFIHGLGSCGDDWQPQVEHFRERYRVVTCDLRGHGLSSRPRGPYSIQVFARDVAALMHAIGIGPAHLVGISLGGMVAFQLAVDSPGLVRSLTIVNSGPAVPAETLGQRLPLYVRLFYAHVFGLRRMATKIAGRLFPGPQQGPLRDAFVSRLASNDKHCYLAALRAIFAGWSVAERLEQIRCPVLVIAADQDYSPVELKQAYVARLPDARLVVIPDSHHALPMEKPREFNQALSTFLAGLMAPGRVGERPMHAVS